MSYKRLTIRDEFGNADIFGVDSELLYNELSFTEANALTKVFNRLALLEDKIDNGTLIDTKVKVGQRVYRRGFFKGEIEEYIVSNIILENGELKIHLKHDFDEHKTCYSVTVLSIEEIGKTIFLTKAESEKKLEELSKNR